MMSGGKQCRFAHSYTFVLFVHLFFCLLAANPIYFLGTKLSLRSLVAGLHPSKELGDEHVALRLRYDRRAAAVRRRRRCTRTPVQNGRRQRRSGGGEGGQLAKHCDARVRLYRHRHRSLHPRLPCACRGAGAAARRGERRAGSCRVSGKAGRREAAEKQDGSRQREISPSHCIGSGATVRISTDAPCATRIARASAARSGSTLSSLRRPRCSGP